MDEIGGESEERSCPPTGHHAGVIRLSRFAARLDGLLTPRPTLTDRNLGPARRGFFFAVVRVLLPATQGLCRSGLLKWCTDRSQIAPQCCRAEHPIDAIEDTMVVHPRDARGSSRHRDCSGEPPGPSRTTIFTGYEL